MALAASRTSEVSHHTAVGVEKRLSAIMFVDVVDFTILAAKDEDRAIAILEDFLAKVAHPSLTQYRAGVRKHLGDGLLATFDRVDDCVDCAEFLQNALALDHENDSPQWPDLNMRIGVHFSEAIFSQEDVLGSGVNLTKRLQEAAAPGAILVSHTAGNELRKPLKTRLNDLGFVSLKGFERPTRAYALETRHSSGLQTSRLKEEIPSIAVLPFESLSESEENRYFADGLVEDIIGSLSGLREMVVIARGSTLKFRDRQIDPREARQVLGVRYVLQGVIRRRATSMRLSATLSDATTGATMFSTRRDVSQENLFEAQDSLVAQIVANIAPSVRQAELARAIRKPPEVFSAYDFWLRALDAMRHLNQDSYTEACNLLDLATQADPGFAAAFAWKAQWVMVMVAQGWLTDRTTAAEEAEANARRAIQVDENNALALATLGHVRAFLLGDHESALAYHERARAVGPGNATVLMMSAGSMAYVGRGEDAVQFAEQAHQLVPLDHIPFREFDWLALANYAAGNHDRAAFWARRALDEQKEHMPSLRLLAASLAALNELDKARSAAQRLLKRDPSFRVGTYAAAHATFADGTLQELWLSHLVKAGLPQ